MKYLKIKDIIINNSFEKVPVGTSPYIEIGDIDIFSKKYQYKDKKSVSGAKYALKDSIIVSTVRPTRGAISIVNEDKIAVSNAFAIINVDKNQCNYKYIFYMINNQKFYDYLGSNSFGAAYPTCSKEDVYNYEIVLPSLDEQNKIVKIFDNIFDSISIKNQQILHFEQLVKSQFTEMFGNNKCKKNMLKNISKFQQGTQVPVEEQKEEKIDGYNRFLRIIDYTQAPQKPRFVRTKGRLIDEKSVVVVRYGATAGFVGRGYSGILANNLFEIIPDEKVITKDYLYMALKYGSFEDEINKKSFGAAMPALSFEMVKDIMIETPSIELQNNFVYFFDQVNVQRLKFEKQLEKLKELRESFIKEYFG